MRVTPSAAGAPVALHCQASCLSNYFLQSQSPKGHPALPPSGVCVCRCVCVCVSVCVFLCVWVAGWLTPARQTHTTAPLFSQWKHAGLWYMCTRVSIVASAAQPACFSLASTYTCAIPTRQPVTSTWMRRSTRLAARWKRWRVRMVTTGHQASLVTASKDAYYWYKSTHHGTYTCTTVRKRVLAS